MPSHLGHLFELSSLSHNPVVLSLCDLASIKPTAAVLALSSALDESVTPSRIYGVELVTVALWTSHAFFLPS